MKLDTSLLDRLEEVAGSAQNRARRERPRVASFQLEEPIASSKIFGYDARRFYTDPAFYVEQNLRLRLWRWDTFPDDDMPVSLDLPASLGYYPEYTFLGMDVSFTSEGVPLIQSDHPLTRTPDLRLLKPVDFATSGWMPRCFRWYDAIRELVGDRLKVSFGMGWGRGCLDLAIQLRGYEAFVGDTIERPQFVHDLLKFLVEQRCRWWEGYCRHFGYELTPGAVADDWINVPFITPSMFADFVLPRYLDIESFAGGILSVHSCGNQTPVQKYLLRIKSLPGLEVSPWTDLRQSLVNIPPEKSLWIALHPNDALLVTPDKMEAKLRGIVELCRGRSYSIATGGLTPITPDIGAYIEKVRAWTRTVRKVFGSA